MAPASAPQRRSAQRLATVGTVICTGRKLTSPGTRGSFGSNLRRSGHKQHDLDCVPGEEGSSSEDWINLKHWSKPSSVACFQWHALCVHSDATVFVIRTSDRYEDWDGSDD